MGAGAPPRSQSRSCLIPPSLSSAFSEWCLIVFLFITATLSHLATKFARFCNLQTPCLFCSRLDHILGRPWFCGDLVCNGHKLQVSCLTYCQAHQKLVYIHDLCENCVLSSAALAGKSGEICSDIDDVLPKQLAATEGNGSKGVLDGSDPATIPLLQTDTESSCSSTRLCMCCAHPFKGTPDVHSKRREKYFEQTNAPRLKDHSLDCLSQIGYNELKISSDSESEVPISDEDEMMANSCRVTGIKNESVAVRQQPQHIVNNNRGPSREKLIDPVPMPQIEIVEDSKRRPSAHESSVDSSSSAIGHGLEEINWSQINGRNNLAALPEVLSEQMPAETTEILKAKGMEEIGDSESVSASVNRKITNSPSFSITKQTNPESGPPARVRADRNDGLKRVLSNRGGIQSPRLSEIISARDGSRTQEDLKALLSNLSSSRAPDALWSDMPPTPRLSAHADETKVSDASSSTAEVQIRNSSGLDPPDVEGENSVDQLKRQVELDEKSMNILYKELDAERSASAVAANQAMAMINRLQEEKAAMQMEALHYLRMMEEQAEYDQEAIQKLNDLLTEREKEILDLEAELESCKKRHGDDSKISDDSNGSGYVKNPLAGLEDERAYISECLSRLEKKIHWSRNGADANDKEGNGSTWKDGGRNDQHNEVVSEDNTEPENDNKTAQLLDEGKHNENRVRSPSDDDRDFRSTNEMSDILVLKHEVSHLNERFKTLEADQKLLQYVLNSLKNTSDGVQFVQEIADHLRELRRTVVT